MMESELTILTGVLNASLSRPFGYFTEFEEKWPGEEGNSICVRLRRNRAVYHSLLMFWAALKCAVPYCLGAAGCVMRVVQKNDMYKRAAVRNLWIPK